MRKFLIISVVVCTFFACSRADEPEVENGISERRVFYAETPTEDTKTYIDSEYEIHWTADDRISVFSSGTNEQYRFTGQSGDKIGSFENVSTPATPTYSRYYAVYPYQGGNTSTQEGTVAVCLPAEQNYVENSFGQGSNTMAAVTQDMSDQKIKFRNACSFLLLKLYGGDSIKSINIRGNNGEKIAGAATITMNYGEAPVIAMGEDAATEITLSCPIEGVSTKKTIENYTTFWIVIPPTTFSGGFTVDIKNTSDDVISKSTTKSVTFNRNMIVKMAPIKVDTQNPMELTSFSLSDGVNTYNAFDISNGYVNVQVPNETDMTNMTATFTYKGESVKVNGVSQTSGVGTHDFSDFANPITYVVASKSGLTQSYKIRMFNLPIVFATTPNSVPITSKETWINNCSFKIRQENGTETDFGVTNLKGRGNYSWRTSEKKSYSVKFDTKPQKLTPPVGDVLGMPGHKRWCLLNNFACMYYGNMLGYELGRRTASQKWAPHGRYVELFINNEHKGTYLLVEQIKLDKNRVDITEMSSSDIEGDSITGGYIIEYDNHFDEVNKFRSSYYNMPVQINEPDEDVLVSQQFSYIQDYINNFEASLNNATRFSNREYLNYLDIDSYIDIWMVWEIAAWSPLQTHDFDSPCSVWFTKERNEVIKSGPVWDFDPYFMKECSSLLYNNCQYYGRLFQDPYFASRAKERWNKYKTKINGAEISNGIVAYLDSLHNEVAKSAIRDKQLWPNEKYGDANMLAPEEQYQKIRSVLSDRINIVDNLINAIVVNYDAKPGDNEDVDNQKDKKNDFNFGF